jgi:ATP-dependent Clp protease ATP-binding subunit ClpC
VFDLFTDRVRRAVVLAQEEARLLNHTYLGTEHLLLGLLREGEGEAAMRLSAAGVTLDGARGAVEAIIGRRAAEPVAQTPFTPRAKAVLERSREVMRACEAQCIDTEHVLIALMRDQHGIATQAVVRLGVEPERLAAGTADLGAASPTVDVTDAPAPASAPTCPRCGVDLAEQAAHERNDDGYIVVFCRRCRAPIGVLRPPAPA